MKKIIMVFAYIMAMISANAHNTHYPTYTDDGITYVKTGGRVSISGLGAFDTWYVRKVDKPYDKTIIIPYVLSVNGKEVRVTGMEDEVFSTCFSLDSLIISDGVLIGDNTFVGCNKLEYLSFSCRAIRSAQSTYKGLYCKTLETSSGVFEDNFWKQISNSVEKIIIKNVGYNFKARMDYCRKLNTIISYEINPPTPTAPQIQNVITCNGYITFESWQWSTITLYVPRESLEKYYFDKVWGEIDNIYALDEIPATTTSISSITNNIMENDVWYSLNGTRVDNPTKGVYIKNGKKYNLK